MKKVDNFNPGKWLVENKITTQSRLNEDEKNDLLSFVNQNQPEVAKKIGAIRLEDIQIDDLGDAGATAIFSVDGDEMESGVAFRFPENVDDDFVGEDGDKPKPITVAGKKLMYVSYNI